MKRKIGILLCCLAVMGMVSVSGMQSKAAGCSHPLYFTNVDLTKWEYDAKGHRKWKGTQWICTNCGYTYWTELRLIDSGDHKYKVKEIDDKGNITYENECIICPYSK